MCVCGSGDLGIFNGRTSFVCNFFLHRLHRFSFFLLLHNFDMLKNFFLGVEEGKDGVGGGQRKSSLLGRGGGGFYVTKGKAECQTRILKMLFQYFKFRIFKKIFAL